MKNLFLDKFSLFSLVMPPMVLKRTSGLPWVGTDEKKFDERFNSSSFLKWNMSSGNDSKLLAARSRTFRLEIW